MTLPWNVPEGELLVGRGWSWKPDKLRDSAERGYLASINETGEPPICYSISTFGVRRLPDESTDAAVARLLDHMVDNDVRGRYAAVVSESELATAGFELQLSEPPPGHYDLPVGLNLEELRVDALSEVFDIRDRRKMPR